MIIFWPVNIYDEDPRYKVSGPFCIEKDSYMDAI